MIETLGQLTKIDVLGNFRHGPGPEGSLWAIETLGQPAQIDVLFVRPAYKHARFYIYTQPRHLLVVFFSLGFAFIYLSFALVFFIIRNEEKGPFVVASFCILYLVTLAVLHNINKRVLSFCF